MTKTKQSIAITVYTDKMIDICYPNSSEEEKLQFASQTDYEKLSSLEKTFPFQIGEVTRVVLDEEFLDWLKQNKLKNTETNRSKYAQSASPEDAERLWKKNHMGFQSFVFLVPVIMFAAHNLVPANTKNISNELTNNVRQYLAKSFNIDEYSVFCAPQIIRADVWTSLLEETEEIEAFVDVAEDWFKMANREDIDGEGYEYTLPVPLMLQKEATVDLRFIPVVVGLERKAILSYDELKSEDSYELTASDGDLGKLSELFSEEFGPNLSVHIPPYIFQYDDALAAREGFFIAVEGEAEKNSIKFLKK